MEDLRWIKFWPADWQRDPAVRMCGLAARGLWIEMICVMHEAEPYGHLLINCRAPSHRQMAALFGVTEKDVVAMVTELEEAGVFSRTPEGVIYSRRMVKDEARRSKARVDGRKGGNPNLRGKEVEDTDNPNAEVGLTRGVNPQEAEAEAEAEKENPLTPLERGNRVNPDRGEGRRSSGSRAAGSNPRAVAAAVKATASALKAAEFRAKAEAHALWPAFRDRLTPAEFAGTIGQCEYRNGTDPPVLIAPTRFLRDHIRTQFRQRLERFDARLRVEFAAAVAAGGGRCRRERGMSEPKPPPLPLDADHMPAQPVAADARIRAEVAMVLALAPAMKAAAKRERELGK